ncbi:MAG: DinB family protein [Actinomycetota bacterium]|nr:DinB family protein [Actinomycetota bacterium]
MAAGSEVEPVPRTRPPEDGTERATMTGLLDCLRATVVNKVAGLSDQQAFRTPVPPSVLTPAGVVKHLTGTERFWFSIDFANADVPWPWTDEDLHGNFAIVAGDTLAGIVAEYQDECERSRLVVLDASLEDRARGPDMAFTLRYALAHMVEETARHCGHLDLLRESIDGKVGE